MEQKQTISAIAECMIAEMERMQYSPQTISTFRVKAKQLSQYVQEKTEASHVRCVHRIGEYQLYGAVLQNRAKKASTPTP